MCDQCSFLDIPRDTIAHAFGHGRNAVTDIYFDFNQSKVDEAIRQLIDRVFYGNKPGEMSRSCKCKKIKKFIPTRRPHQFWCSLFESIVVSYSVTIIVTKNETDYETELVFIKVKRSMCNVEFIIFSGVYQT